MKNSILLSLAAFFASASAFAQDAAHAASSGMSSSALYGLGAALGVGIAALGGALGQGKIGSSAMDGIARNPQAQKDMFVSMIIGLVLIESLVIYALVVAVMLIGKI